MGAGDRRHCTRRRINNAARRGKNAAGDIIRRLRSAAWRAEVGHHYNILLQGTNVQSNVLVCIRNERI